MSKPNLNLVENCLQGKECKACLYCEAEVESWNKLEQDFTNNTYNFYEDLNKYLMVKGKRKCFEQKEKGEYLTISEPEALQIFSRY